MLSGCAQQDRSMANVAAYHQPQKSLPAAQRDGFFVKVKAIAGLLVAFALAVGIYLLAQHGQQAAVALLGLTLAFQLQQAGVNQVGEVLYGVGTFGRGGHGRKGKEEPSKIANGPAITTQQDKLKW
jgi:hypothetical protein